MGVSLRKFSSTWTLLHNLLVFRPWAPPLLVTPLLSAPVSLIVHPVPRILDLAWSQLVFWSLILVGSWFLTLSFWPSPLQSLVPLLPLPTRLDIPACHNRVCVNVQMNPNKFSSLLWAVGNHTGRTLYKIQRCLGMDTGYPSSTGRRGGSGVFSPSVGRAHALWVWVETHPGPNKQDLELLDPPAPIPKVPFSAGIEDLITPAPLTYICKVWGLQSQQGPVSVWGRGGAGGSENNGARAGQGPVLVGYFPCLLRVPGLTAAQPWGFPWPSVVRGFLCITLQPKSHTVPLEAVGGARYSATLKNSAGPSIYEVRNSIRGEFCLVQQDRSFY